jgi:hypothetical protein
MTTRIIYINEVRRYFTFEVSVCLMNCNSPLPYRILTIFELTFTAALDITATANRPSFAYQEFITPPALLAASRKHYEHTNHPSRESPCGSPDHHIEASIVSCDARDPGNCRRDDHRYDGGGCPRPYYDDVPRFSPNNIPRSSCDDAGRRSYYAPPQAQNYLDDSQRYSHHEFRHEDQRRFQQQNYQDESRRFHDRSHYQSYDPRYQHSTHRQHAPPQYDQRFLIAYPVA